MSEASEVMPRDIETERLVLRPFELGDVDDVYAYARDPEWARFLPGVPQPYERKDAEQFIAHQILSDWTTSPTWGIEIEGHVHGGINLTIEREHLRAWLGYGLAREHWGQGITTEAVTMRRFAVFPTSTGSRPSRRSQPGLAAGDG